MKNLLFTLFATIFTVASAAQDVPLVYSAEQSNVECALPPLPAVDNLPSIVRFPNPFEWSDGSGEINAFADWACRRSEIKAEIEHYEIGIKPPRPADVQATYADGTLTVVVNENGHTLTLTSDVSMPEGTGTFPVIIGMDNLTGSLSASHFEDCIKIGFNSRQLAGGSDTRNPNDPYFQMYPDLYALSAGHYSAWAWGVSRIIDGIELVQSQMHADLQHIGVTGCSYAGKMALFAGAFDERVALTIAQESGGGGTSAWRITEGNSNVENISNTNYSWFMPSFRDNFSGRTARLPYDHHELLAMVAPRALLVLGNDGWTWMADETGYVSCMAAREVYKRFGIADRFGWDFTGGHNHCSAATSQDAAVTAFVDRFLRGNDAANTDILTSPYQNVNYQFWLSDWADVTEPDVEIEQNFVEAESETCALVDASLSVVEDVNASNGRYVSNLTPADFVRYVTVPFYVNNHRTFHIYLRINTTEPALTGIQIDNNDETVHQVNTGGQWQWVEVQSPALTAGAHTLKIGFGTLPIKLDRINITNDPAAAPTGMGGQENLCDPTPKYTTLDFETGNLDGWTKQNGASGISITQEDMHGGSYAMKMVNGSSTNAWSVQAFTPPVDIVLGHVYNVSFWVRAVGGGGKGRISTVEASQLGTQYWSDFTVGDSWEQITYNGLTAAANSVRLAFDMGYIANKTYYIDDIVFDDTNIALSVKNIELQGVNVYSNSKGKISVTAPDDSKIVIFNITGQAMGMYKMTKSPAEISISSGIYIVRIENGNARSVKKVIVK
ncbi:MAG: carbohydrate binding domain-containing protein [Prevotellaceae bacterium]|jgi:hypothetical protein|nr:carbohydrate binding domain-containing protein [Prevotellaceae bacterium]